MKIFDTIIVGPGETNIEKAILSGENKLVADYKDFPFSDTPFPDRSFLPKKSVNNRIDFSYK